MKKLVKIMIAAGVLGIAVQSASAEVTALSAKFAGGCHADNTGTCAIKVTASGSDFESDSVLLERADTAKGRFRYVSKTARNLSDTGRAEFKFKNEKGCYKVVTAANGNDTPDVRSRVICE